MLPTIFENTPGTCRGTLFGLNQARAAGIHHKACEIHSVVAPLLKLQLVHLPFPKQPPTSTKGVRSMLPRQQYRMMPQEGQDIVKDRPM
jgi:hypothetical protein